MGDEAKKERGLQTDSLPDPISSSQPHPAGRTPSPRKKHTSFCAFYNHLYFSDVAIAKLFILVLWSLLSSG